MQPKTKTKPQPIFLSPLTAKDISQLWHDIRGDNGDSRLAAISIVGTSAILAVLFSLCLIFATSSPFLPLFLVVAITFILFCSISKSHAFASSDPDAKILEFKRIDRMMLLSTSLCTSLATLTLIV